MIVMIPPRERTPLREPLTNPRNPMNYFPPGTYSLDRPTTDHRAEDGEQCRAGGRGAAAPHMRAQT